MFHQMYTRSVFEVRNGIITYVWIAQLFIIGLVVGYIETRYVPCILENSQELEEHLHRQIVDIQDINESNVPV